MKGLGIFQLIGFVYLIVMSVLIIGAFALVKTGHPYLAAIAGLIGARMAWKIWKSWEQGNA